MNEHDTEVLCGMLESMGFIPADDYRDSDLLVVNTCAVRKKAEDKVTGLIGELIAWKKKRKGRLLAVGGCMIQQKEVADYFRQKFRHVDILFGTHSLPHFPRLMKKAELSGETVVDTNEEHVDREGLPIARKNRYQAWVPVIYGCNNFCSYCVVPYVRGRERSRPMEEIITEVENLASEGCKEITLLGQNVNAYGKDMHGKGSFSTLLEELNKVDGLKRIRFMTSHPRDFDERIISVIAYSENICKHFHLPIQSGSDHILSMMNRGYTRTGYRDLINNIRGIISDASITTDFIVGFPGETDEDFKYTMDLLDEIKFDAAYTFLYSERRGTPALRIEEKVPPEVKKERITRLIKKQQDIGYEINQKLVGSVEEVLVEGPSKNDPGKITGRTGTNKLVHFEAYDIEEGDLCHIKITRAKTWHLSGELVTPK